MSAFETPLGRVELDTAALAQLADLPQVSVNDAAHAQEHSLEVQLPFLQRALGDVHAACRWPWAMPAAAEVAQVLERVWGGDETLVVISTDLSHYLPYAEARATDRATVERILRLDPALDHDQACGATPLAGALLAARAHGLVPRLLDLRNSGDTAGDRSRVVGYCAIAFEPRGRRRRERRRRSGDETTTPRSALRCSAARATRSPMRSACLPPPSRGIPRCDAPGRHLRHPAPPRRVARLRRHACRPSGRWPTTCGVHALAAAFRDSRFEPLRVEEFAQLEIEVSLLEPALPLAGRAPRPRRTPRCGPASTA